MEVLKEVSPAVFKVAVNIWAKSADMEQYSPPRMMIEKFELRRNELERSLPHGKKLETVNCFFNPTSEGQLRKVLVNGWAAFDATETIFFSSAAKAIQEQGGAVPYPRIVVVRVCLGREGIDFTVANGRYRVRDLNGVMTSFLLAFKNSSLSGSGGMTPPASPFKVHDGVTSPAASATSPSYSSPSAPKPKWVGQVSGDGMTCPSCNKENAGNTRYCVRCGGHL
ncbi:hypothetical protein SAMD00019534_098730 [Acytostelium subglobosum LB1]|uniref:hypothetical protein n=1 Tax=Acytostelium subglobosum LB1 TaxID=1410327 RepID=UPI000645104B|nr:hypothetical protein SAMD00019534_098730 [Acytostelium subglobosum LB1]GAM26698.1 hypothetical protein SAMD00019534_098730 [Acytostelium subglobosum LB1]|eukprot:XP_012750359.1 hypothetical protein SAMD00019534_098730 [Acytostelium subglobosum LB1]